MTALLAGTSHCARCVTDSVCMGVCVTRWTLCGPIRGHFVPGWVFRPSFMELFYYCTVYTGRKGRKTATGGDLWGEKKLSSNTRGSSVTAIITQSTQEVFLADRIIIISCLFSVRWGTLCTKCESVREQCISAPRHHPWDRVSDCNYRPSAVWLAQMTRITIL